MASGRIYQKKRAGPWFIDVGTGRKVRNSHGREVYERLRLRSKGITKRDAQEELEDWLFKLRRAERTGGATDNKYPAQDLVDYFLKSLELTTASQKTLRDYEYQLRAIMKGLAGSDLYLCSEISAAAVEDYLARRSKRVSARSCNVELQILKRCLQFGVDRGLIATNPVAKVKRLARQRTKFRRALTLREVAALLRAAPERWRRLWFFLLSTGLREMEVCYLRWRDVDLSAALVHVRERDGWKPKTDGSARSIPVGKEVVEVLQEMYGERVGESGPYVFESGHVYSETESKRALARRQEKEQRGERIVTAPPPAVGQRTPLRNNVLRTFRGHLRQALLSLAASAVADKKPLPAGVERQGKGFSVDLSELDIHSLRYTFITELISRGEDPKTVQTIAGHKDVQTTLGIYAQCRTERMRAAAESLPFTLKGSGRAVIRLPSAG